MSHRYALLMLLAGVCHAATETSPPPATPAAAPQATSVSPSAPPNASLRDLEPVVMARVGKEDITVEQFMQFLAKHPSRVKEATTDPGKAALLRELIETRLLLMAMREEGFIGDSPKTEELQLGYQRLAEKEFPRPPTPDNETLRRYYEAHIEDFGIPASVRLSQIQFRVPDSASDTAKSAARSRAEAALERVNAGEPFGDVAAEVTENTLARPHKGDLGYVERYGYPWLENAVKGLKIGEHTGVLPSPVGYDILMVTDLRDAVITPFEDARDAVIETMTKQAQDQKREAYVKSLANQVGVSIELEELKDDFPNGVFP